MIQKLFPILACFGLFGCSLALPAGLATVDIQQQTPFVPADVVANLPPGSRVRIVLHLTNNSFAAEPDSDGVIEGTVLQASPDGVALKNCLRNARQITFSNSGTTYRPVQWVSIEQMTSARVVSSPSSDAVPPQLDIETNATIFRERKQIKVD